MTSAAEARASLARLAQRVAGAPAALRRALAAEPPALGFDPRRVRALRTTGIGSSAAHARHLAFLLGEGVGLPARFTALGEFVGAPPAGARDDVLVVFSQGLSPNACFALREPRAWRRLVLVTAVSRERAGAEPRAALERLDEAGALVLQIPGEDEFETLMRVTGPLCGYAAGLVLARAVAQASGVSAPLLELDAELACRAVEQAPARLAHAIGPSARLDPRRQILLIAQGAYAGLVENLRSKLLEGLLCPAPPVWDPLEFAHGPFQQAWRGDSTLLALSCAGAPGEAELLARVARVLDPRRQQLWVLPASLPAPHAIFEHEALLNALVLRSCAAEAIDPERWPGRGEDAALYGFAPRPSRQLEHLTWPELEAQLASGRSSVVLPLGATEQHGPHLPFATDSWIAAALAERFCARVPEAIAAPVLAFGCSSEHLAFPGTLHVRPETLAALLRDVLASLREHGFARAFLFSAHGGNFAWLASALPELARASAPLAVSGFTDLDALTAVVHRRSLASGVDAAASGHHAGEFETSIVAALAPAAVRRDALRPGLLHGEPQAQALFHPSLRAHSASGVVGDPRGASAERAEGYLSAWVDLLVERYRRDA